MVYPAVVTGESTANRSASVEAFNFCPTQSTAPSILLPQPPQHLLYSAPFQSVPTCTTSNLPPQYIYVNTRRNPVLNSVYAFRGHEDSLHTTRSTSKWLQKSHGIRINDHHQLGGNHHQHPLYSYTQPTAPFAVLYDPLYPNHLSPTPAAPQQPIYVNQASNSFHSSPSYPTESYSTFNNPNITFQPPYYKPYERQTFCVIPDPPQHHYAAHQTYYNIPSNLNLQHVKSIGFHASSVVYPTSAPNNANTPVDHEGKLVPLGSNQLFENPVEPTLTSSLNPTADELTRQTNIANVETNVKFPDKIYAKSDRLPYTESFIKDKETIDLKSSLGSKSSSAELTIKNVKSPEDKFSDESFNFDFTIEAEKMVSALCNSSFHELLDKDELEKSSNILKISEDKEDQVSPLKNIDDELVKSDGDQGKKQYKPWYLDVLEDEQKVASVSVGIQTNLSTLNQDDPLVSLEESQYPELMRKTLNFGITEAEKILKNVPMSSRQSWLSNLLSGTKIACSKSFTCFPVFAGDEIFVQDLINALLRISNGWLILHHYLNKQHHPNLEDKFDKDLIKSLKNWEASTDILLKHIIKTFIQLGNKSNQDNSMGSFSTINRSNLINATTNSSFPGDICLYVNFGLFGELSPVACQPPQAANSSIKQSPNIDRALSDNKNLMDENLEQKQHCWSEKETKLRTKWTITELQSAKPENNCPQKMMSNYLKPEWNIFSKDDFLQSSHHHHYHHHHHHGVCQLNNKIPQYNFFLPHTKNNEGQLQMPLIPYHPAAGAREHPPAPAVLIDDKYPNTVNFAGGCHPIPAIPLPTEDNVTNRPFWPPCCLNQTPLFNNFYYNDSVNNSSNKITILNPINPDKKSDIKPQPSNTNVSRGETINLSAWFASMRNNRNRGSNLNINSTSASSPSNWWESSWTNPTTPSKTSKDSPAKNPNDNLSSFRNDINRQIRTLKNMRTIQTAPWITNQLINDKNNSKGVLDEYDSSSEADALKVYMKPGSYNVPRKKFGSKRSQKQRRDTDGSKSKTPSNNPKQDDNPAVQPNRMILSRKNNASLASLNVPEESQKDIAWKAACASAELLLDSLTPKYLKNEKEVEGSTPGCLDEKKNIDDTGEFEKEEATIEEIIEDDRKIEDQEGNESKSEWDRPEGCSKTNIKTDSWLIKTLNEAYNDEKNKIAEENDDNPKTEEKRGENVKEDDENELKTEQPKPESSSNVCDKTNAEPPFSVEAQGHTIAVMTLAVDVVGKATYSETVRRFSNSTKPMQCSLSKISSIQMPAEERARKKDSSYLILLNRPSDSSRKKEQMDSKPEIFDILKTRSDKTGKSNKKNRNQIGDKSWSVWYSSRRKQNNNSCNNIINNIDNGNNISGLGPLAHKKLVSIHRVLWRMDVTRVFKCPTKSIQNTIAITGNFSSSESITIEKYHKVGIKNPLFLETIGYKLKNHCYNRVEHAIRDFKKIVNNSKVYHKNNKENTAKIEVLSRKLEELMEKHFCDEYHRENSINL